jgi:hypothetical protein
MSPEVALSGHANDAEQCPLSGAKQTWLKDGVMSAFDRCCRKISFYGRFGFKFAAAVGRSLMH